MIKLVVFDFDGVLTDNMVYVTQDGVESVRCSRADGLGFKMLKAAGKQLLILSTECNPVVAARAKKLDVPCITCSKDKVTDLQDYCRGLDIPMGEVCFIGNDVNDIGVMEAVGLSMCPIDAYPKARSIADVVLESYGGHGVTRDVHEQLEKEGL